MSKIYPVLEDVRKRCHVDGGAYERMYEESVRDAEGFWGRQAELFLHWHEPWDRVCEWDFVEGTACWFRNGKLNACYNCLDRHLESRGEQTAFFWEGDDAAQSRTISYRELHEDVCRLGNVLRGRGVGKGDRVCIYLPMIPEAVVAMLACARIGAVHSVVFGGFSPKSLRDRILDADCQALICADQGLRGGAVLPLKENADAALRDCPGVHTNLVVRRSGAQIPWQDGRDLHYEEEVAAASAECPVTPMDAEDPLFILYTSGSTGKPKGVLHTTGGYLLYAAMTHKYLFDYHDGDRYWCAADVGWVTGHSYIVYGPLANGATSVLFEGTPTYPTPARAWEVVDKYQVNIFYTAPTVLRTLMGLGDAHVQKCRRSSLRILGTVGEPINPEAWEWYHRVVGEGRCPIVDTWWQTETGAAMIAPLPGAQALKPGSATRPFFGVQPVLLDEQGRELAGAAQGALAVRASWPGQIRTVFGDHQRCVDTYFKRFPGYYFTGDEARRDADGDYWITGRLDDVLNVSGHRLGTAEIESALVLHPLVAEAAAVGYPHQRKGQGIYVFVTLMQGAQADEDVQKQLVQQVRKEIGAFAQPDFLQWSAALPKTRSGKIMRRILRKIAAGDVEDLGDTSTLADPSVVEVLVRERHTTPQQ